jgi:hypothetical protein
LQEISSLYKNHIRTVRAWVKAGLPIIEGIYPYLVKGSDLKEFLFKRQQKQKVKLEARQFYCTKCKTARNALNNQAKLVYSGKTIGKGIKDFTLQGICEICGTKLNRISNENKLDEVKQIFDISEILEA